MPEILLHYIWQKHLWSGYIQTTTDGQVIEIISAGQYNTHAGPDFSNAHIRIGDQEWVGNIEIHVNASDWYKHHHDHDPAYDNTILHVVCTADKTVFNTRGEMIPQCELQYPHNQDYMSQWLGNASQMMTPGYLIECSHQLQSDPSLITLGWKKALLLKRLECKRKSIEQILTITQQSWTHAFYISLAHNFGFHTNGIPFETLAIQTPLSYLLKHRDNLFQLTAILLGQSGLLNEQTATGKEEVALWREYEFLRKKFSLTPMNPSMWKRARMRPQNAPEIRIRQFAQLIHQSEFLFSELMQAEDIATMVNILQFRSDDTNNLLTLPPKLGRKSIDILLINTIIPYQYAYALAQHKTGIDIDNIIEFINQIPAEDNRIIKQWRTLGQHIQSAADTQALLHLYQNYCQPHQCYNCQVGYQIFAQQQLSLF
ncbi:MAG: DUF2851 family protein [Paludibacteraceae bacterium]|nr:DUF2851 family protein [Paludibacteraceae bacterium]